MTLNDSLADMYKRHANNKKRPKREEIEASKESVKKEPQEEFDDLLLKPQAKFENLHGCIQARDKIANIVDHFKRGLSHPQIDESNWPILICGSRGLGKTSLVEAAANYGKLNYFRIELASLSRQSRNEFEVTLEHTIRNCVKNQPAIVLVDDLNRLSEKQEMRNSIQDVIQKLVKPENKLLVFCTTSSSPEDVEVPDIDFSSKIYLKRPDYEARLMILRLLKSEYEHLSNLDESMLKTLATNTPSFTAPDLRKILLLAERDSNKIPIKECCDAAIEEVKQNLKRGTHLIGQKPSVTWKDIGGMSEVRQAFIDILRQTKRGGINCKFAGIALYGPPGCGKTMVAQAMANEAGFNFISIKPAELINKFLGETEKNIRRVFHEAREHEPCMIYFDEFDGLCGTRGNKDNVTSAIQTLLAEMDGFVDRGKSIILASTNRLEDIDPAMKRPGRLSKHIYVGPPNQSERCDILRVITSRATMKLDGSINLETLACQTDNFTGAELDFLISEAESKAMRDFDINSGDIPDEPVVLKQEHMDFAMNKIKMTNKELNKKTRHVGRSTNS